MIKSFKDICIEWLSLKKIYIKHSTYVKYEQIIDKHIFPYFENIQNINNTTLYSFFEIKKQTLSSSTLNTIKFILSSILEYGHENYHLPTYNFKQIKIGTNHKTKEVLSNQDREKIIQYICNYQTPLSIALLFALYGGLRLGEICALQWKHIDFERKLIYVQATATRLKCKDKQEKKTEVMIQTPKSLSSYRDVPMPDFVFQYIKKYYNNEYNDYVLSNDQHIYEPRRLEKNFQNFCHKQNIHCTFHNLRHSYATECVQQNVEIKTLSEILGHSNISITLDLYVHPTIEQKQKEISKIKIPSKFVD